MLFLLKISLCICYEGLTYGQSQEFKLTNSLMGDTYDDSNNLYVLVLTGILFTVFSALFFVYS